MTTGGLWARKVALGRETTAGTSVAATTLWRGAAGALAPETTVGISPERIGVRTPSARAYIAQRGSRLSFPDTPATFEQLPHILEAGIMTTNAVADGAGSGKIYAYTVSPTSNELLKTYTIETGDNVQAQKASYMFVESFGLAGDRGEAVGMSAEWVGRAESNTSFTTTATAPAIAEEIIAPLGLFYIDPKSSAFGTTAVTGTLLKWGLDVTTGWAQKFTVDGNRLDHAFHYFNAEAFAATLDLTYEHNSTVAGTEKAAFDAGTVRKIRLRLEGSALTTAGTYSKKTLLVDIAGVYTEWSAVDADDGNSIITAKLTAGYDATAATVLAVTVVNQVAAIP